MSIKYHISQLIQIQKRPTDLDILIIDLVWRDHNLILSIFLIRKKQHTPYKLIGRSLSKKKYFFLFQEIRIRFTKISTYLMNYRYLFDPYIIERIWLLFKHVNTLLVLLFIIYFHARMIVSLNRTPPFFFYNTHTHHLYHP